MNIVYKDVTFPKLTIAKDRVEVKIPLGMEKPFQDRVLTLANRVVEEVGEVTNTLRGKFETRENTLRIQMYYDITNGTGHSTRKSFKTFMEK
jgi:hypothetical protein